jgi:hypothetical protein
VFVQHVVVALSGGQFDLMVGEPFVFVVAGELLSAAAGLGVPAFRGVGFGALPGPFCVTTAAVCADGGASAGDVVVVGGVAGLAVAADPFA